MNNVKKLNKKKTVNITCETANKSNVEEWKIIDGVKKWVRNCPNINCNREIFYSFRYILKSAIKRNTLCKLCANKGRNQGKTYEEIYGLEKAIELKAKKVEQGLTNNPFKGKHHSNETKQKLASLVRLPTSDETKKKLSDHFTKNNPFRGKTHTDETKLHLSQLASNRTKEHREKIALAARLRKIKSNGKPFYNKLACQVFDELNRRLGWNGQHALNGGEKQIIGYSLDYYEPTQKLVIEWDEPHHLKEVIILKDKKRETLLINELGNDWIILRWNEKHQDWRKI